MINNLVGIFMLALLTSCTLSFQNITNHGDSEDLIDENISADADIKPNLTMPKVI